MFYIGEIADRSKHSATCFTCGRVHLDDDLDDDFLDDSDEADRNAPNGRMAGSMPRGGTAI